MDSKARAILFLCVGLAMACGASGLADSSSAWASEQTWQFGNAWNYTFLSEVISVNNGGNSLAELNRLPDQRFWKASYQDPRPHRAPEYHHTTVGPDRSIIAVGSNTDSTSNPLRNFSKSVGSEKKVRAFGRSFCYAYGA